MDVYLKGFGISTQRCRVRDICLEFSGEIWPEVVNLRVRSIRTGMESVEIDETASGEEAEREDSRAEN